MEDKIFHLGVIAQITDEVKVSRPARAQRRIFVGILGREYQAEPREAIVGRLTKYAQESKNKFQQQLADAKARSADRKTSKKDSQTHRKPY